MRVAVSCGSDVVNDLYDGLHNEQNRTILSAVLNVSLSEEKSLWLGVAHSTFVIKVPRKFLNF